MKSKRNSRAGKHPSYDKKGMSDEQIKRKREYDKKYNATKKRKEYRAKLNAANKEAGTYGNGDGMDMSHTKDGRLVKEKRSSNRARNGQNGKSTKRDLSKPLSKSKFDPADYNKNGYVSKKERRRYNKNK
jgi:hypothetical protein